jgi:putative membrane protein
MMGGMMGGGWNGFGSDLATPQGGIQMFLMGIVPLLIIGLVVWLVIEATRRGDGRVLASPGPQSVPPLFDARSTLDERYARGEIDREEYLQRRADLGR